MNSWNSDYQSQEQHNLLKDTNVGGDFNFNPVQNLTQYIENISQSAPGAEKQKQEEYRQRKDLLDQVEDYWIEGILRKSLHGKPMIKLVLEKRSDAVERPVRGFEEEEPSEESGQAVLTETDATEVFSQGARALLILGGPGAGKTITLLKLAQDLIARAKEDESLRVPVVFNLSSWGSKHKQQTIADWLIDELYNTYKVSETLGKTLIKGQQLILLLDGLDEVEANRRKECIDAINQFMNDHGLTEVVVCSHIQEYKALSKTLKLRDAVSIRPLTPEQISQYLDTAGEQLEAVKTLLTRDPELQELAKSPLMLSVMTEAYKGKRIEDLPQAGSPEERREHLFDAYIKRMFNQEKATKSSSYQSPYQNQQAKLWLTWLAQQMSQPSQSVFLIEQMQPTWLRNKAQKRRYRFNNTLIGGFIFGLIFWLLALLSCLWAVDFDPSGELLLDIIKWCFINGLVAFLFFGLVLGWGSAEIQTVETIKWSWKKAKNSIASGVSIAILVGLLLSFAILFWYGLSLPKFFDKGNDYIRGFGLVGGFIAGLSYVLINALKGPTIQKKTKPNQGIWVSLKSAIIIVLMISIPLIILILFRTYIMMAPDGLPHPNIGLRVGLRWALTFGIGWGGGVPCIRHFTLRRILHRNNDIPWNYASFLDYATERGFLQKVGGGYIFIHRMLLKHFARMNPN